MAPIKIVIAEDHRLVREMVKKCILEIPDLQVVGEVSDGLELLDFLKTSLPDMVILDIAMPKLRGLEAAKEIKKTHPEIKILIMTMHKSSEYVYRALAAGVEGYILKENAYDDLIKAIESVREGKKYISSLISEQVRDIIRWQIGEREGNKGTHLSPRELQVLRLIAQGKTGKEIAELLSISDLTVYNHRVNIKKKLKINRTADLVKYALQQGYI